MDWQEIKLLTTFALCVLCIMGTVFGALYFFNKQQCYAIAEKMSMPAEHNLFAACMVKDPKLGWRPIDQRRQVE